MKKPGQVTWAFHGWDGGIVLRFFAQSCSKQASARDFTPPNPRMYAASLLIQAFGSQPELSKNSLDIDRAFSI